MFNTLFDFLFSSSKIINIWGLILIILNIRVFLRPFPFLGVADFRLQSDLDRLAETLVRVEQFARGRVKWLPLLPPGAGRHEPRRREPTPHLCVLEATAVLHC